MSGPWEKYQVQAIDEPPVRGPWQKYGKTAKERAQSGKGYLEQRARKERGYVEGIDYTTGVQSPSFRAGWSRMDTDKERENWLNKNVGQGGWARDAGGRFVLTQNGLQAIGEGGDKPRAVDATTLEMGDLYDFAGEAGPAVGAGILGGMAATGLGTIPAALIAGGAAAAGKLVDEGVETLQGYQRQDVGEVAKDAAVEGAFALTGEGLTRSLRPLGRMFLGPHRHAQQPFNPFTKTGNVQSTIDPERIALSKAAIEAGFRPSPAVVQGDKGILWPKVEAAARWFGNPTAKANAAAADAGRKRLLEGVSDPANLSDPEGAVRRKVTSASTAREASDVRVASEKAKAVTDAAGRVGRDVGRDEAGAALQENIRAARREFADQANKRYAEWAASNQQDFSTLNVKQAAKDWLDRLPSKVTTKAEDTGLLDASGNAITRETEERSAINALSPDGVRQLKAVFSDLPDNMSASEMQNLRAYLREAAYDQNILPGIPKRIKRDMLRAVDDEMEVSGLSELNQWYRSNISKFDDARILRITRDAGKTGSIDAEEAASFAIRPGNTSLVKKVKEIASPETWDKVKRAHFDDIVDRSTGADGAVDSLKFSREVSRLGLTLDEAYGPGQAKEIRALSKELLMADEKIPLESMRGSSLIDALRTRKSAILKEEALLKNSFVKAVTSGNYEPQRLASMFLKKENSRFIAQAKEVLGEGSDEWAKVQKSVVDKLINRMAAANPKSMKYPKAEIDGAALQEAIDEVGVDTVKDILGPNLSKNLLDFSRQLAFSLQQPKLGPGGIMTSAIALRPSRHLGMLGYMLSLKWALDKPGFIKFMTEGYEAKTIRALADNAARALSHSVPRFSAEMAPEAYGSAESAVGVTPQ